MSFNENTQAWLDALRSGHIRQWKGALHEPSVNGYCCLGVACELYRKEHPDAEWLDNGVQFLTERETGLLPPEVAEWVGLPDDGSPDDSFTGLLARKNDSGHSFLVIADIIEDKLLKDEDPS